MSGRVSATAIGAFMVGVVGLLIGAMIYFGGSGILGHRDERRDATVIFTGSVKGLGVGAPVTLRGVEIGEVLRIDVSWDPKAREFVIPVSIWMNSRDLGVEPAMEYESFLQPLIERGMRAQLKTQSLLTGLLYIDLDFLPGSTPRYVDFATASPQIPTAPTELEAILQRVSDIDIQSLVKHADDTLVALGELLNNPEIREIPTNVNATLAELQSLMRELDQRSAGLAARADGLLLSTDHAVGDMRGEIATLGDRLERTLNRLDTTLESVRSAAGDVGYSVSEQSPLLYELTQAVAELGRAGRSLQALSDSIEREPEALLRGKRQPRED